MDIESPRGSSFIRFSELLLSLEKAGWTQRHPKNRLRDGHRHPASTAEDRVLEGS